MTPADEPTLRCWKCGKRVPESQASRRDVSRPSYFLGLFDGKAGGGTSLMSERVDLCSDCTREHDETNQRRRKRLENLLAAIGAVLIVFAIIALVSSLLRG